MMGSEGFKRKLAAIFSADVKDYSRLMGEDEAATVRIITAYREVMTTLIQQHRGRVLDSPGGICGLNATTGIWRTYLPSRTRSQ